MIYNFAENKELIDLIALNRFTAFETVNASKKQKQATNTIQGCTVGTLAEMASLLYFNDFYNDIKAPELTHYLQSDVVFVGNNGDIEINNNGTLNRIEVKGTQYFHPQNCITPYHTEKYILEGIDAVVFVAVDLSKYEATINGLIDPVSAKLKGKRIMTRCENIDCTEILMKPLNLNL